MGRHTQTEGACRVNKDEPTLIKNSAGQRRGAPHEVSGGPVIGSVHGLENRGVFGIGILRNMETPVSAPPKVAGDSLKSIVDNLLGQLCRIDDDG
jgi:hypothetical protein